MLFKDKLNKIEINLSTEFDRLFEKVIENQSHDGDLLLILENGFYNPEVYTWNNLNKKISPYMIGPNHDGHSSNTHYEFIHTYRTGAIADLSYPDYLEKLKYIPEKRKQIGQMQKFEGQTIQLEMLIYLKIWEADKFIKKFYQIARLLHGIPYDWHFKIAESNRDNEATGNRKTIIIKKIRDKLKDEFQEIHKAFKIAYKTQIRNSISHSKYSIVGRNIHLNNYIKDDTHSQLHSLSFDEWIDILHYTMIIYNEQIKFFKKTKRFYSEFAKRYENKIQIKINRKEPEEKEELKFLKYTPFHEFGRWT